MGKEWLCPKCKRTLHAEDMDASRISIVGVTGQKAASFVVTARLLNLTKSKGKNSKKLWKNFTRGVHDGKKRHD